jgi:ABC-type multidrug transport system permease subunit
MNNALTVERTRTKNVEQMKNRFGSFWEKMGTEEFAARFAVMAVVGLLTIIVATIVYMAVVVMESNPMVGVANFLLAGSLLVSCYSIFKRVHIRSGLIIAFVCAIVSIGLCVLDAVLGDGRKGFFIVNLAFAGITYLAAFAADRDLR